MPEKKKPRLIDLNQTCKVFSDVGLPIARRTIINRMSAGTWPLKPRRFSGKVYFNLDEVNRYIENLIAGGSEYEPDKETN